MTGFSIGGRVIDGNADGVDAVEISVDGQVRSVTDSLGYYKLDQVWVLVSLGSVLIVMTLGSCFYANLIFCGCLGYV